MERGITLKAEYGVIGLGAIGAFTVKQLADAGHSVIGIDRYSPPHVQGSTHGDTRLIREAYSEDSRYIPILRRAIDLWRELNAEMGRPVFHETGVNYLGPKDQFRILATQASAAQYDINLRASDYKLSDKLRHFSVPEDWSFFHETGAGYIQVEPVLSHILAQAENKGAVLKRNHIVESVRFEGGIWHIITAKCVVQAKKLIICAGAWAHEVLPYLKPYLTLERHSLHWFSAPAESHTSAAGFKPFTVHTPEDDWFYGFPEDALNCVKIAEHNEGPRVEYWQKIGREVTTEDIAKVTAFKNKFLPHLGDVQRSSVCMYTMTPDGNFIIDDVPGTLNAVCVAGLSGHGYKFAPALAEIAIHKVNHHELGYDMSMFALSRFP